MKLIIERININEIILLKEKYYNNISIKNDTNSDSIEIEINNSLNENDLLNNLDTFISLISEKKIHKLSDELYFDENNALIKGKNFNHTLTNREVLFLKNLIMKKNIITYDEMFDLLWRDSHNGSINAIRLFIKNLKKKIPQNILSNYQGMGYKINL